MIGLGLSVEESVPSDSGKLTNKGEWRGFSRHPPAPSQPQPASQLASLRGGTGDFERHFLPQEELIFCPHLSLVVWL